MSFFYGSPRQAREAALRAAAEVQAWAAASAARRVQAFRDALPAHRKGWFDLLSDADQIRLAIPRPDNRDDFQRDRDGADAHHGWPEA